MTDKSSTEQLPHYLGLSSPDGDASALSARYRLLAKNVSDFVEHGADFVFRKHTLLNEGLQKHVDEGDGGEPIDRCAKVSNTSHVEITPEMIEAGVRQMELFACDHEAHQLVRLVYIAMCRARPCRAETPPQCQQTNPQR